MRSDPAVRAETFWSGHILVLGDQAIIRRHCEQPETCGYVHRALLHVWYIYYCITVLYRRTLEAHRVDYGTVHVQLYK